MYNPFHTFFSRTPHYPFISLEKGTFEAIIQNHQIQEAIYIASPVLYAELQKYLAGAIINTDEKQKIELSAYRYNSRMTSRCTPFGLFAGCSTGEIAGDQTNIILGDNKRHTRLDMYFLCSLSQELSKLPDIREKVKYYPNTSLYHVGKKYRYIEYQYRQNSRIHRISSVERSACLDTIIKTARKGVRIDEFLSFLLNEGIEPVDASAFIEELINSQVIVSELSPSVTGDDFLERIICILEQLNCNESLLLSLKEILNMLRQLDSQQEDNVDLYQKIIKTIKEIKIPYEEKYLFQVDLTRNTVEATLGQDIVDELQSTMIFLNKITIRQKNETLQQFSEAFYKRYEDYEVPLMEVLDTEIGIGYPANKNDGDISPLLENFFIPSPLTQEMNIKSNAFQSVVFKKAMDAKNEIILNDEDVKNFKPIWDDLPPTMHTKFEIVESGSGSPLIQLNGFFGACGANMFARFTHADEKIAEFVKEIAEKDQELLPDVILAEIAHLPDSRVGNVLSRPHIRDYEILYLAYSDLPENRLIYMSDLYLSIRQGKLFLRSKRLNKEIVPRLTNAHNFRNNPMPVYRFLCDMQMQHGRNGLYFNWGYLNNELNFLPRVRYRNTILSLATWKIRTAEMKQLFAIKTDDQLLEETKKWRENYPLPQKMLLSDGDNELLVDWEDARSIKALFSIIKKRGMITLTEFLYDPEHSVVRDEQGNPYLNECIAVFYKDFKK